MRSMTESDQGLMPGIAGKAFIVTGGHRGIGLAFVVALLKAGASVGVLDLPDIPDDAFKQMQAESQERCFYSRADVSDLTSLSAAMEAVSERLGRVDGCITAAGICVDKSFTEHTWQDYQRQSSINSAGTFFAVQWVVRKLQQTRRPGSIVMVASQAARHICPGHLLSAYSASKGAVLAFSRNLAIEVAGDGIRVNTISPGYIDTEMNRAIARQRPGLSDIFQSAPPLRRMGTVNDLSGGLLYLLSDLAGYVTGVDLAIDGGMCVSASNGK